MKDIALTYYDACRRVVADGGLSIRVERHDFGVSVYATAGSAHVGTYINPDGITDAEMDASAEFVADCLVMEIENERQKTGQSAL